MSSSNGEAVPTFERLLTTKEAAEVLRVSPDTLERWRVLGEPAIPFLKLGPGKRARVFYLYRDLQAFRASSLRTSTSDKGRK